MALELYIRLIFRSSNSMHMQAFVCVHRYMCVVGRWG